jgi:subtilisin family serine protease
LLAATVGRLHAQETIPGRIYIKFESADAALFKSGPEDAMRTLRVFGMSDMIPVLRAGEVRRLKGRDLPDDLERTFEVRYDSGLDPAFVASKLNGLPGVVYAEPLQVLHTQLIPNDPLIGQSGADYFTALTLDQAWNTTTSSADIVIAIVDSGTDYTHPDLAGKHWRNPTPGLAATLSPLLSQVANDTIGWNFWDSGPINNPVQNADPKPNGSSHGTHVGGLAAANTNNGQGIAGSGFNSRYMVVRAGGTVDEPTAIGYGYPGILYAALNGADVINCSFGGPGYSSFGADVVRFATSLGSLVVGAAGNTNTETTFYPASYPEVLSVGSVASNNVRSSFSSYGFDVDVMSRGSSVLSTMPGTTYALNSGTSMASPIAAGIAALVRHQNPSWGPERVRQQIRSAANSSMYSLNASTFAFKMGNGLIDANRAVTTSLPGVEVRNVVFLGPSGRKLGFNELGTMSFTLVNHGASTTSGFTVNGVAMRTGIEVAGSGPLSPGVILPGDSVRVSLPMRILSSFDFTQTPLIRITMTDAGHSYSDFHVAPYTNFLYDDVAVNRVRASFASNGTIGYENANNGTGGIGFVPTVDRSGTLDTLESLLYEAGLMISYGSETGTFVINQMRAGNINDAHFKPTSAFALSQPGVLADVDGIAMFNSSGYPTAPKVDVTQEVFAFDDAELNRAVLVKYTIKNSSATLMRSLRAGLFADWDIGQFEANTVGYSSTDSLLYAFSPSQTSEYPYVAMAQLGAVSSVLAIDNAYQGLVDSLNFGTYFSTSDSRLDGYTRNEKLWSLNAGKRKTSVQNTDVAMAVATGPYMVEPGQEVVVGFVLAFGETLDILKSQVAAARSRQLFAVTPLGLGNSGPPWIENPREISLLPNYPNPFNPGTTIRFTIRSLSDVDIAVYDLLGRKVAQLVDRRFASGEHRVEFDASNLPTGQYVVRMSAGGQVFTRKITLLK